MNTSFRTLPDDGASSAHVIADHFDHFFSTLFASEDSLKTAQCFRMITREPHPIGNIAVFSREATAADVTREGTPLCEDGFPSAITFLGSAAPELLDSASALGFSHAESMPLMSVTPETLAPTSLPHGYTLREVPEGEADAWALAVSSGYGLPLPVGSLLGVDRAAARCPGKTRHFAVEHDGRLVATSLVYLHDGLAGIYGVATLPEHRGKGLGAHLTAEPLRRAWDLGYITGLLQASEMGAPVYERIGFRTHGHMPLLVRVPA